MGVGVAGNLFPDDFPSPAAGVVIAAVLLLTAPVHWWIGRALNSTMTPQGRVWHDRHTYFGAPIEKGVWVNVGFALIAVSIAAGAATSPIVGWAVLVGTPIIAGLVLASRTDRARLRTIEDRQPLAAERGWRYKNSDARLATRWKARERGRAPYTASPFGIVAGELNGLPFTAFDTEAADWGRHTSWAVHLPVAYPKIVVRGPAAPPSPGFAATMDAFFGSAGGSGGPQSPGAADLLAGMASRPEVEGDDAGFAAALATPDLRRATQDWGLQGWLLDGRDLILSRRFHPAPCPAVELAAVAERLTALALRFPPGLAERYGTAPTTDVPLTAR
ncbi:MAG TPA: hypothetical protein VH479_05605 [Acidimicrobiales bacterium]